ncbi:hypothetical protein [Corynebacterium glutamicum]|uniref:hypothetical protein n=1 Tax=Corynebacterium glutamicum TaxID=1718 RepID=UPI0014666C66|nr:hypothetical protein [Corynebacterium glutamicum]GFK20512.1 hypothetical protein KbCgl_30840 [Corynebacterium glutamicum]
MQFPNAGLNAYFTAGQIDDKRRWSNASGVYGQQVAEAAMALLLGLIHMHPTMVRADSWAPSTQIDQQTKWLDGATVAIVGAGGIVTSSSHVETFWRKVFSQ